MKGRKKKKRGGGRGTDRPEVNKTEQRSHQQTGTKSRRELTEPNPPETGIWGSKPGLWTTQHQKLASELPELARSTEGLRVSPQTQWQREAPTAEIREFQCTSSVWQIPRFTDTRFPSPVSCFYSSPTEAVIGSLPGRGRAGRVPGTKEISAVTGTSL